MKKDTVNFTGNGIMINISLQKENSTKIDIYLHLSFIHDDYHLLTLEDSMFINHIMDSWEFKVYIYSFSFESKTHEICNIDDVLSLGKKSKWWIFSIIRIIIQVNVHDHNHHEKGKRKEKYSFFTFYSFVIILIIIMKIKIQQLKDFEGEKK